MPGQGMRLRHHDLPVAGLHLADLDPLEAVVLDAEGEDRDRGRRPTAAPAPARRGPAASTCRSSGRWPRLAATSSARSGSSSRDGRPEERWARTASAGEEQRRERRRRRVGRHERRGYQGSHSRAQPPGWRGWLALRRLVWRGDIAAAVPGPAGPGWAAPARAGAPGGGSGPSRAHSRRARGHGPGPRLRCNRAGHTGRPSPAVPRRATVDGTPPCAPPPEPPAASSSPSPGSCLHLRASPRGSPRAACATCRAASPRSRPREEEVRLTLELASAVRDQYAHQAHTIILGNDSHLHFYEEAERRVVALTAEVKARVQAADERAWVEEIERTTADLDRIFRQRIVPAVLQAAGGRHPGGARPGPAPGDAHPGADRPAGGPLRDRHRRGPGPGPRGGATRRSAGPSSSWPARRSWPRPSASPSSARWPPRWPGSREGAARLAAGDLDTRIEIDSPDEFGALAAQFNAMTRSLAEHQERLVQSEKLAGIGRLAAGVAHEINNPLAVILGYVKLLRRKAEGGLAEDLAIVEDEAGKAQQIVEGLLDLARAPAAAPEPVDLRALCDEAVARLQETGRLAGAGVTVTGVGQVAGQPHRLRQVVLNLVRNGAEAAGPGGGSRSRWRPEPAGARVEVRDSGTGLPRGGARQALRAVLHHQADRHRARPGRLAGHRPGPRRRDHRRRAGGRRRPLHRPPAGHAAGEGLAHGPAARPGGGRQGEHPQALRAHPRRRLPGHHRRRRRPGPSRCSAASPSTWW